jgi:hypothetical protein
MAVPSLIEHAADADAAGSTPNPTIRRERVRNLLSDARAAEARIEVLDLENRGTQFFGRSLVSGQMPGIRGKKPLILATDEHAMKSQQRRASDGDGAFHQASV